MTKTTINQEPIKFENEYVVAIDFATKLGWSIYKKIDNKWSLVALDKFIFKDKVFNREFKNSSYQNDTYQKTIFYQSQSKNLINTLFGIIKPTPSTKVQFIFEFSDFGYRYAIESVTRLFTIVLLEISSYHTQIKQTLPDLQIFVSKMLACKWRKAYKDNHPEIDWKSYEAQAKKKKVINWKVYALQWLKKAIVDAKLNISEELVNNNDIAEAALIGWTWINYMQNNKK